MSDDFDRATAPYLEEMPLAQAIDLSRIGPYRGFGEIVTAINRLRDRGARVSVAGRGHDGAPLLRVELGPPDAKSASLLLGGIHAMEWIGVETGLSILESIADTHAPDRRIVAFPILNPDGFRRAEAILRARRFGYVRGNAHGVDLNRNWPTHWKTTRLAPRLMPWLGSAGPHAGSEPEVRAVLAEIEAERARGEGFERAISLHSFGSMLLLPYGGRFGRPREYPRLHMLAERVQGALRSRYRIRSCSHWVPGLFAFGMEVDHLLHAGIDPLLVECSNGGFSLFDPGSWTTPFRWYNPRDPGAHTRELSDALVPFLGYGGP